LIFKNFVKLKKMSEEKQTYLKCDSKKYSRSFSREELSDIQTEFKDHALKEGFESIKPTGLKNNSVYFVCARAGKSQKQGDGKRSKSSKRIGNNLS